MNTSNRSYMKGFAFIQVILWFAVTASLALVSTFALTSYFDQIHFEDDLKMAQELTEILDEHPILSGEYYSAHDIRKLIRYHSGKTYDFNPKTSNAGFFYIVNQNKVIVSRFKDIEHVVTELGLETSTLLNDSLEDTRAFHSPEELFGNGIILLSTHGSIVSETVSTIRSFPESPYTLDIYRKHNRILKRPIKHMIDGSHAQIDLLSELMEAYHPERTLYVNNIDWSTKAKRGEDIEKILFAAGISNIPTYDLGLRTSTWEVVLPITIKTIEEGAFTRDFSSDLQRIIITSASTVRIIEGAIEKDVDILHGDFESITLDEVTDYSDSIDFSVDAFGTFKVDFSNLEIRSSVVGYRVVRIGAKYLLYIFSDEGLIGYAEGILSYD
jgi:hypothetical protein